MFCYKCGGAVPNNASSCPHCSTPVPAAWQDAVTPAPLAGTLPAAAFPAPATAQFPPQTLPPQTEDKAVISLVLGVLALVSFSILTGIPAIISGKASRERIRASGGRLTGDGMATAGMVMGWISVGFVGFVVVILLLIFLAAAVSLIPGQR